MNSSLHYATLRIFVKAPRESMSRVPAVRAFDKKKTSHLLLPQRAAMVPVATPRVGAKSAMISREALLRKFVLKWSSREQIFSRARSSIERKKARSTSLHTERRWGGLKKIGQGLCGMTGTARTAVLKSRLESQRSRLAESATNVATKVAGDLGELQKRSIGYRTKTSALEVNLKCIDKNLLPATDP